MASQQGNTSTSNTAASPASVAAEYDPKTDPKRRPANSKDPGWEFGYWENPNDRDKVTCKMCSKKIPRGIKRFKQHLAGGYGDVILCPGSSTELRKRMKEYLDGNKRRRPLYLDEQENEEDEDVVEVVQEEASRAATANSQVTTKVPSSGTASKRRQSTLQFKPAAASKGKEKPNENKKSVAAMFRRTPEEIVDEDVFDGLEFARGSADSTWGSVRAAMGHPKSFPLKFVAIGNEDCDKEFYQENYLEFYNALKEAYPDIQVVSNCENSSGSLGRPADLYDSHIYSNAIDVFLMKSKFDRTPRTGPKVFVSEYAVNEPKDAGQGNLLASLAEAALLTGLETNSDIVQMACYAPLFTNDNDRRWNPDAIVFNSWQQYGTPSYWMQTFFRESSGAMIHPVQITSSYSDSLAASAITWNDTENSFLRVKIVNFGSHAVNLTIRATGLQASTAVNTMASRLTVLTSSNVMDENSFSNPNNVVPIIRELPNAAEETHALLNPYSLTSFDLALEQKAGVV